MAARYDVAARHAEGTAAAEHTQSYVWACHLLGYQHPDLTAHGSQVRDWYASEAGLDLHALDRDGAELRAAAAAVEEALRIQRDQLAELAANWAGSAAAATVESLRRHCGAAATVVTGVRTAAQGCADLLDQLWQLVDAKVTTAVAIDDRTLAQRPAWLAAAQAVTAGAGDRPAADEMVSREVKPYVDSDIRTDWLTAMRFTLESVAASYDALTDRLSTLPAAQFRLPGDLGCGCPEPPAEPVLPPNPDVAVPVTPAAAGSPPGGVTAVSPAADSLPTVADDPLLAPSRPSPITAPSPSHGPMADVGDALTAPPVSQPGAPFGEGGGLPAGAGDLGAYGGGGGLGSLGSLVGQIADVISGLVGSLAEGLADPSGVDGVLDDGADDDDPDLTDAEEPDAEEPDEPPDGEEAADRPGEGEADDRPGGRTDQRPDEEKPAGAPDDPGEGPGIPGSNAPPAGSPGPATPTGGPSAVGVPPPGEPTPPAPPGPQPGGQTPCATAAEGLPQVGR
ncbi:MAG: hypothetical protein QJR12_10660 [Mycobacterium sp.]|uniref:hypothetical protein n=1 Tax=Mycobacterium sp. TaxID=1785 RepID=UPI0026274C53|nr:hypothetical protein [Mycobacterium sp.]MDI3314706.1 hypothetical protein [Mycobacterium sp.]